MLQFRSFYDYASHEIAPALDVEPMGREGCVSHCTTLIGQPCVVNQ